MKVLVVGGAGFIGSYVVDYLLGNNIANSVVVYDNFSAGPAPTFASTKTTGA